MRSTVSQFASPMVETLQSSIPVACLALHRALHPVRREAGHRSRAEARGAGARGRPRPRARAHGRARSRARARCPSLYGIRSVTGSPTGGAAVDGREQGPAPLPRSRAERATPARRVASASSPGPRSRRSTLFRARMVGRSVSLQLVEQVLHRGHLIVHGGMAGVHHVHEHVGVRQLLQRGLKAATSCAAACG